MLPILIALVAVGFLYSLLCQPAFKRWSDGEISAIELANTRARRNEPKKGGAWLYALLGWLLGIISFPATIAITIFLLIVGLFVKDEDKKPIDAYMKTRFHV